MITPSDVRTKFPEFASLTDDQINVAITEAVLVVDEAAWGTYYDMGLLYMTAHILAPSYGCGAVSSVGPIASQTIGRVSVTYAVSAVESMGPNSSTVYGQRYDWYVANYIGRHILVV